MFQCWSCFSTTAHDIGGHATHTTTVGKAQRPVRPAVLRDVLRPAYSHKHSTTKHRVPSCYMHSRASRPLTRLTEAQALSSCCFAPGASRHCKEAGSTR